MEIIGETEKWKIEEFGVVISIQHEMIDDCLLFRFPAVNP